MKRRFLPMTRDKIEEREERWLPIRQLFPGSKIGTSEERELLRSEEDRQWPAPLPRRELEKFHIDRVDIRMLLPVDLDRDKVFIEDRSDFFIFEGLLRHHLTPSTPAISAA